MSKLIHPKNTAPRVLVRRDHFDWAHPNEEQIDVNIRLPGKPVVSFSLPPDRYGHLYTNNIQWTEILRQVVERFKGVLFTSQRNEIEMVEKWVCRPRNAARLDLAYCDEHIHSIESQQERLANNLHHYRNERCLLEEKAEGKR